MGHTRSSVLAGAALISMVALFASAKVRPLVVFEGNAVINDEVYRAVLDLPPEAQATPANARLVRARLLDFLRRAGYDLATANIRIDDGQMIVAIDEGKLDKVIILGEGAFQTLRLKLELTLPWNVFNRPLLERQLDELSRKHQLERVRWALVPVKPVEHVGPQIELGALPTQDVPLLAPGSLYELRIYVEHYEWGVGLAPEINIDSLEGVSGGARFRDRDTFFDGDRSEYRVRIAAALRSSIDEQKRHLVFARALLEGKWYTPPLIGDELRSFVWLSADMTNKQREDLGLDSYYFLPFEASANLELELWRALSVSLGGGLGHRILFEVDRATTVPVNPIVDVTPTHETRPFVLARANLWLNRDEIRRDRRHEITLEGRFYTLADDSRLSTRLDFAYTKMFGIGFHELWLKGRASMLTGGALFVDELGIGSDNLRGPFGDAYFVRKLGSLGLEFRYSVARDLVKLSAFHDVAAFGILDRATANESVAAANAFGAGVHVLFLDAFQIDAYFGVGFSTAGNFDHGLVVHIRQAF